MKVYKAFVVIGTFMVVFAILWMLTLRVNFYTPHTSDSSPTATHGSHH